MGPKGLGRLRSTGTNELIWVSQIPGLLCNQNGNMTFIPLGSQTDLLQRSVDIYGNSPNFSPAILNTNLESAVLGQCPGNQGHNQGKGLDHTQSGPGTGVLGRTLQGPLVDLKRSAPAENDGVCLIQNLVG